MEIFLVIEVHGTNHGKGSDNEFRHAVYAHKRQIVRIEVDEQPARDSLSILRVTNSEKNTVWGPDIIRCEVIGIVKPEDILETFKIR